MDKQSNSTLVPEKAIGPTLETLIKSFRESEKAYNEVPVFLGTPEEKNFRAAISAINEGNAVATTFAGAVDAVRLAIKETEEFASGGMIKALIEGAFAYFDVPAHDLVRRMSWQIADLLNDLNNPHIEFVTIRASKLGPHAIHTGFEPSLDDTAALERLSARLSNAQLAWDDADSTGPDHPAEIDLISARQDLLSYIPSTMEGVHAKAVAMLNARCIADWDDMDRDQLIRAFINNRETRA